MTEKSIILVCPLDWGIGHASRLIPIISDFIKNGHKIIIAGEGKSLMLLKETFPELSFVDFKGYNVLYSKKTPMFLKVFFQIPKILKAIKKEHQQLEILIEKHNVDIVLSDNRFGLWTKKAKCIYITHQLMIKMPGFLKLLEYPIYLKHKRYINKYDECWIPDIENRPNIAGDLTTKFPVPENSKYIGILSRFSENTVKNKEHKNEILVILSGPEPQRTIFENILIEQISNTNYNTLIVRGLSDTKLDLPKNIRQCKHLNSIDLQSQIVNSEIIICRSGYSTIMDLIKLKKNAVVVPTPGQTEQEYLAKYYHKQGIFYTISQKNFDLKIALSELRQFNNIIEVSEFRSNFLKI